MSSRARPLTVLTIVFASIACLCVGACGPLGDAGSAAEIALRFRTVRDVTYLTVGGWNGRLDLHVGRGSTPAPTVIFMHGGGWTRGTKEGAASAVIAYLKIGLNVVNVEYRLGATAPAPAAVEDCACALRWVARHAAEYGIDAHRLVLAGDSAGAHLAMMIAMAPASEHLDRACPDPAEPAVAAIVNWYGPSDMTDLLDGPHRLAAASEWFGGAADRAALARRLSPITYVRPGLPPVLTIHGDADAEVPYAQSVALHRALTASGVPNQLFTIPGAPHGPACCNAAGLARIYDVIREFLTRYHVIAVVHLLEV